VNPETRYWVISGACTAAGLILLTAAAITHARDHRRQP